MLKNASLAALGALLVILPPGVTALMRDTGQVSEEAISEAKTELACYGAQHPEAEIRTLAVVDYSRPSFMKRMVVIDLKTGRRSPYRVAHGKNSGELLARRFSNVPESNMSSLGLFRVTRTYSGDHGLAMRLEGLDSLRNGNADMRDIVLHSADYASIRFILWNIITFNGPRIGRSNGCFVVSRGDIGPVILQLGRGGFIYSWKEPGSAELQLGTGNPARL
jgi:hypothetical protein